jgi:hypothetical protein
MAQKALSYRSWWKIIDICMNSEVSTATFVTFWVVIPSSLVGILQLFRGTCCRASLGSVLRIETARYSEALISTYKTVQCHYSKTCDLKM